MLKKLTGIDVFEIALAFNPINKKKFFTVKDGAVKPPVAAVTDPPTPVLKDEPVTPPAEPVVPVTEPVTATPAEPIVAPIADPPAPVEPVVASPATPAEPITEPVAKDDPFKSFKDTIISQGEAIATLTKSVEGICTALKDASMLPATEPDKSEAAKDGKIDNDFFLPGSNS